jgi:hypothetical protein
VCRSHRRCQKKADRAASRAVTTADEKARAFILQIKEFADSMAGPDAESDDLVLSRWALMLKTLWRKMALTAGTLHVKMERRRAARKLRDAERLAECTDAARREKAKPLVLALERAQAALEVAAEQARATGLTKAEYDSVPLGMDKNAAVHARLAQIPDELVASNEKLIMASINVKDEDRYYNTRTQKFGTTYEAWIGAKLMKDFWIELEARLLEQLKATPTPQQLERQLADDMKAHQRCLERVVAARVAMDAALANGRPAGDEKVRSGRVRIEINGVVRPATAYTAA